MLDTLILAEEYLPQLPEYGFSAVEVSELGWRQFHAVDPATENAPNSAAVWSNSWRLN